jgi:hypothetical protein
VSTAKSLFLRRESNVWDSLRSQRAVLTKANERLAQQSAKVADLWILCDELKSEATSARVEALSAQEQVAS